MWVKACGFNKHYKLSYVDGFSLYIYYVQNTWEEINSTWNYKKEWDLIATRVTVVLKIIFIIYF
jgi:hypothetical protein